MDPDPRTFEPTLLLALLPALAAASYATITAVLGSLSPARRAALKETLPEHERVQIETVLERYRTAHGVAFDPLRTVESGRQRFVFAVLTVPADWTVKAAHDMTEQLEADIDEILPGTETFVHVEPQVAPHAAPEAVASG